jgi:NAD(P)-dependent dehydrogenase (short-subunit alcohol dehydrogenase family)
MNPFDLTGKVALLTGPAGNLGPIWQGLLEANGATVIGVGLPEIDLTDLASMKLKVEKCIMDHGPPDIFVHNAAVDNPPGSKAALFWDWERIIEVNLGIGVKMIESLLPGMLARDEQHNIVIIGSMLGFVASNPYLYPIGFDKPIAYGASKAALWNVCQNLNNRYAPHGIITNMLALSAVEGNQAESFKQKYKERIPSMRRMLVREDFEKEFLCCCTATAPYWFPLFVGGGFSV